MIRDYQAIQKTWFVKGKQRIIPTFGKHQGLKLIGTLNYETGEVFCIEEERYIGCNKEFPISMSRLYHLTSWHGDKKSEQYHGKQNGNLYMTRKHFFDFFNLC